MVSRALEKPGITSQLPAVLAELCFGHSKPGVAQADNDEDDVGEVTNVGRTLKVLVAEDNKVNRMVIQGLLNKLGHTVLLTSDGQEVCERAIENHALIDVVLMDCEMPVMDGFEATRTIRRWEENHGANRLPIVALTAHALADWQLRSFDAGMDEHLAKPIKLATYHPQRF